MNATPYIEALGKETGMDITLSASGAAALSLGGRNLLIQWIEATHSFIVYVEVGALGGWRNGEICRRCWPRTSSSRTRKAARSAITTPPAWWG